MTQPVYLATGQTALQVVGTSVEVYGAKGDGVTDDSAAFQTAANALAGTGVPLLLRATTYLIANLWQLPSNLTILGAGVGRSIIKSTLSPVLPNAPLWGSTSYGVAGTLTSAPQYGKTIQSATGVAVGSYVYVASVAQPYQSSLFRIEAVTGTGPFTYTVDRAILRSFISGDTFQPVATLFTNTHIKNLTVTGTGVRLVNFVGAWRCTLEDVEGDTSGGTPVSGMSFEVPSYGCTMRRCRVRGGNAIQLGFTHESAERCMMDACSADYCSNDGIQVIDGFNNTYIGCSCSNNALGIVIVGGNPSALGSFGNRIIGGNFSGNSDRGVVLGAGARNVAIGAEAHGNTNAGFDIGDSTVAVSNCRIIGCSAINNGINFWVESIATDSRLTDIYSSGGVNEGVRLDSDATVSGLTSVGDVNQYAVLLNPTVSTQAQTIERFTISGANYGIISAGATGNRYVIRDGRITTTSSFCILQNAASLMTIENVVASDNGAGKGFFQNATNCIAKIGVACDFTGATTPITLGGAGSSISQVQGQGIYTDATTSGTVTLTHVQAASSSMKFAQSLSNNITYNVPAGIPGVWSVDLSGVTLNAHTFTVGVTGGSGVSLTAAQHLVYSDGTNMKTVV